jgi:outer membrane lipase/esterase
MKSWKILLSAVAAALVVVGCGGGGSSSTTTVPFFKSVKVVGDSLSDSGTFAGPSGPVRFAMQGNAANPMKVWTELVAEAYGAPAPCAFYSGSLANGAVVPSTTGSACNNYAVGGAKINSEAGPTSPYSIPKQLTDLATKPYLDGDLLLVDGGGNDVAALATAFLDPTGATATFVALTSTLLGNSTVVSVMTANTATGAVSVGVLYMEAVADKLFDAVTTNALNNGAKNVLVLNVPDITGTPRFLGVLASVSAAYGGGPAGANASAQVKGVIGLWIQRFNARLVSKFGSNPKVAIADFYTDIQAKIATPTSFGLTNITDTACPSTSTVVTCTADSLTALAPPSGATGGANWWKTYYFSDGFHPSIKGYQLLAADVLAKLSSVGWK